MFQFYEDHILEGDRVAGSGILDGFSEGCIELIDD